MYSFRVLRIDVSVGSEKLLDHFEVALSRCEMQRTQLHTHTSHPCSITPIERNRDRDGCSLARSLDVLPTSASKISISIARERERSVARASLKGVHRCAH